MRDMKMRDQIARVENAGKVSMESQSVKKCLNNNNNNNRLTAFDPGQPG